MQCSFVPNTAFLGGGKAASLQKQIPNLKAQRHSQPGSGNTSIISATSSTLVRFSRKQVQLQMTTHHGQLCSTSLVKHLGRSGFCSASRKYPVPHNCPPPPLGVHAPSKSSTFVTHAAVITMIFPSTLLSAALLFLSASLSTHGWLHASKRRVVVVPGGGGKGGGGGQKRRSVAGKGSLSMSRKTCGLLPQFILCKPEGCEQDSSAVRSRRIYGSVHEKLEVNW